MNNQKDFQPKNQLKNQSQESRLERFLARQNNWLYPVLVVLLFFGFLLLLEVFPLRVDLTKNNRYTLSKMSRQLVSDLHNPLRVSVFISKNAPPPFNNVEVFVRDLLYEYGQSANENFQYAIYDVTEKDAANDPKIKKNRELAADYGIYPINVQVIEKDEVKVVAVYFAMVIEYGDMIEKIVAIKDDVSLEYQVSSLIHRMNSRLEKLLGLEEKIQATLYLPQNFVDIAPVYGVKGLSPDSNEAVKTAIKDEIEKSLKKNYGKIAYQVDNKPQTFDFLAEKGMRDYQWKGFSHSGKKYTAGVGSAALLLTLGGRSVVIELLDEQWSLSLVNGQLQQVPMYSLTDFSLLSEKVDEAVDELLGIHPKISYLRQGGTMKIVDADATNPFDSMQGGYGRQAVAGANFYKLINSRYQVDLVDFSGIDNRYKTLILAGVSEKLSDHQLYLIDQFLLKGGSLLVFHNMFQFSRTNNLGMGMSYPEVAPKQPSGLESLLEHYGVKIEQKLVMDEQSYVARKRDANGSIQQETYYYIPTISSDNINNDFMPLKGVNFLIMALASPLKVDVSSLGKKGVIATALFSSSKNSWVEEGNVPLSGFFLKKPKIEEGEENKLARRYLGYVLDGSFESYFKGKKIPQKQQKNLENPVKKNKKVKKIASSKTFSVKKTAFVEHSVKPGRIVVVGSTHVLTNNLLDPAANNHPNAVLWLNLLDYANGQDDWIEMRAKSQIINPIVPYDEESFFLQRPSVVKSVNMVFWPTLGALFGGLFWLKRRRRRERLMSRL